MDHADDVDGKTRRSREFTLETARTLSFACTYCRTPVFATQMPNWKPAPGVPAPRKPGDPPELYFKARPEEPHPDWCDFGPAQVRALIARKTVSSRSGASGRPPVRIDLEAESVHRARTTDNEDADGRRRNRSVDDGEEKRRRGPRETVVSHIRRACEAYAAGFAGDDDPLSALPFLPASANTYGRVFKSLGSHAGVPARAIWFATLRFKSRVHYGDATLRLFPFGTATITIDRSSWPTMMINRFDAELRILLEEAGRQWTEGSAEAVRPTFFALAERSRDGGSLVVSDYRLVSVLLLTRSL